MKRICTDIGSIGDQINELEWADLSRFIIRISYIRSDKLIHMRYTHNF